MAYDQRGQTVNNQVNISIEQQSQDAKKMLENGVQLVRVGAYKQAINILTDVIKITPLVPTAYYYLALALLEGKRPKVSIRPTIESIERNLETACQLNSDQAHYYYLWALVKYDFYFLNGFMIRPPSIKDLLQVGRQSSHDVALIVEMLEKTKGADNEIVSAIIGE
jgi:tetratricopeptide (TPR) repeat protein